MSVAAKRPDFWGIPQKNVGILRSSKKPSRLFDVTYYDMEHEDMTCMGVAVFFDRGFLSESHCKRLCKNIIEQS